MSKKVNFSFFYLITLFLMFLLGSIYSHGQGYRTFRWEQEQIIKRAKWRVGPFRIYPTIQLRDIGYDDNVYNQRDEDNPISDYTVTFSPQVKVYLLYRNFLILTLTEEPEWPNPPFSLFRNLFQLPPKCSISLPIGRN